MDVIVLCVLLRSASGSRSHRTFESCRLSRERTSRLSLPQLSPLRVAVCLMVSGHFSRETRHVDKQVSMSCGALSC